MLFWDQLDRYFWPMRHRILLVLGYVFSNIWSLQGKDVLTSNEAYLLSTLIVLTEGTLHLFLGVSLAFGEMFLLVCSCSYDLSSFFRCYVQSYQIDIVYHFFRYL